MLIWTWTCFFFCFFFPVLICTDEGVLENSKTVFDFYSVSPRHFWDGAASYLFFFYSCKCALPIMGSQKFAVGIFQPADFTIKSQEKSGNLPNGRRKILRNSGINWGRISQNVSIDHSKISRSVSRLRKKTQIISVGWGKKLKLFQPDVGEKILNFVNLSKLLKSPIARMKKITKFVHDRMEKHSVSSVWHIKRGRWSKTIQLIPRIKPAKLTNR